MKPEITVTPIGPDQSDFSVDISTPVQSTEVKTETYILSDILNQIAVVEGQKADIESRLASLCAIRDQITPAVQDKRKEMADAAAALVDAPVEIKQ